MLSRVRSGGGLGRVGSCIEWAGSGRVGSGGVWLVRVGQSYGVRVGLDEVGWGKMGVVL